MGKYRGYYLPGDITHDYGNHSVPVNKVTLVTFLESAKALQILTWSISMAAAG